MPKYETYMIQSGVRSIYQQHEIAPSVVGYIKEDVCFSKVVCF